MRLITARDKIRKVASRFYESYCRNGVWRGDASWHWSPRECYERLLLLDLETCSVEDVVAAVNETWVYETCSECRSSAIPVLLLGDEPDYGSATVMLCFSCVQKVAAFPIAQSDSKP